MLAVKIKFDINLIVLYILLEIRLRLIREKTVDIRDREIKREKELMKIEVKVLLPYILSLTFIINPIYITSLHLLFI